LEQGHEDMGQDLVRTIADEHRGRVDTVMVANGVLQVARMGVGIQSQAIVGSLAYGVQYRLGGPVRVLIGIELDQIVDAGLLARHIRCQALYDRTPELAHVYCLLVRKKLSGWRLRP